MDAAVRCIIILVCSGLFIYHAYNSTTMYLRYPTAQTTTEKALSEVYFPTVEICISPGYHLEFLKSQGYHQLWHYVNGISGGRYIGWAGNGSMTTDELIEEAYAWRNAEDILATVTIHDPLHLDNLDLVLGLKEEGMHYPEGKCFSVTGIQEKIKTNENLNLDLKFKNISRDVVVSVFITDSHRKYWKRDIFSYSGISIKKQLGLKIEESYDVYHLQVDGFRFSSKLTQVLFFCRSSGTV